MTIEEANKHFDVTPQTARVISLREARRRFGADKCQHLNIEVDKALATVECLDCREKLNPVAILARFAGEENLWQRRAEELESIRKSLDAKVRCKCQHCGRMTT